MICFLCRNTLLHPCNQWIEHLLRSNVGFLNLPWYLFLLFVVGRGIEPLLPTVPTKLDRMFTHYTFKRNVLSPRQVYLVYFSLHYCVVLILFLNRYLQESLYLPHSPESDLPRYCLLSYQDVNVVISSFAYTKVTQLFSI